MVRSGMPWMSGGIRRGLAGQMSNLSGKPTFLSVLLNDGWVAVYDPKQPLLNNKKLSEGGFGVSWWPGADRWQVRATL